MFDASCFNAILRSLFKCSILRSKGTFPPALPELLKQRFCKASKASFSVKMAYVLARNSRTTYAYFTLPYECNTSRATFRNFSRLAESPDPARRLVPRCFFRSSPLTESLEQAIDALKMEGESGALKMKRLALGKVARYLRDAGTLFNKVDTNSAEINQLHETCTIYFNLLALFSLMM